MADEQKDGGVISLGYIRMRAGLKSSGYQAVVALDGLTE